MQKSLTMPAIRALLLSITMLLPALVCAEPITYHLVGTVTFVDNGSDGTLDMTGMFTVGMPLELDVTVERSTVPIHPFEGRWYYVNAATDAHFTIGSYVCTGSASNSVVIENDYRGVDDFEFNMYTLTAPGDSANFYLQLRDITATALDSEAIPKPMPDLSAWINKWFSLTFFVSQMHGNVNGDFTELSTPSRPVSWGGLKNLYRQ